MKYQQREKTIQKELCRYVSLQYPKAIFVSDLSGLYIPKRLMPTLWPQIKELSKLRSCGKHPDWELREPTGKYHGLFIEIKAENNSPFRKDNGVLKDNPHLREQQIMLINLERRGYKAVFGVGLHECMVIVDKYLKNEQ